MLTHRPVNGYETYFFQRPKQKEKGKPLEIVLH
jgi:hypothetical protein